MKINDYLRIYSPSIAKYFIFYQMKIRAQFSSVQFSCSVVSNSLRPHEACQASLSITNSWSSPKLMSIELVMPSSHLILCRPILLLPPIPPSIRVFPNESTLHMRWPKYWSFFWRKTWTGVQEENVMSLMLRGSQLMSDMPGEMKWRQ